MMKSGRESLCYHRRLGRSIQSPVYWRNTPPNSRTIPIPSKSAKSQVKMLTVPAEKRDPLTGLSLSVARHRRAELLGRFRSRPVGVHWSTGLPVAACSRDFSPKLRYAEFNRPK
jgi:hypothetical protein